MTRSPAALADPRGQSRRQLEPVPPSAASTQWPAGRQRKSFLKSVHAVRPSPTTIPYSRILRHSGSTLPDISRSLRAGRQVQRRLERLAFDLNVGIPTVWHPACYPPKNVSTLL